MKYSLSYVNPGWDRYYKGYYYEMLVQEILTSYNIEFKGNSTNLKEWNQSTNTNYDIVVKVDDSTWLRVECKFSLKFVYNSWFYRDWNQRDCDIIVTNNKKCISNYARNVLHSKGVALLDTYSLVPYINQYKNANKNDLLILHKGISVK